MRRYKAEDEIIAEINITPLTDVALVLLVIFMVTTPLILQGGINVKLPAAITVDTSPARNITVSITKDGRIFINDRETDLNSLPTLLESRLKTEKEKTVIINADKKVYHGVVVSVMDAAKKAGALKLAIVAEKMEECK
ncbi:MAG: biopolymer transporter ExbD [Candidatus Firestonebacteria bacterium]